MYSLFQMKSISHMSAALLVAAGLFTACSGHETDGPVVEKPDMIEISDENTTRDFTAQGGTWQIDFTSSKDWTTTKSVSLVTEWYHFTPGQGKAGKGKVTITVFPNTTGKSRSAEIRIAAGRAEQTVTITQQAGNIKLTPEEEIRTYLERLYHDTDGDNWRFRANWCSDKPISEWNGVSYEKGLLTLRLDENNLKGSIDLSGCTALAELHCQKNSLTGINVSDCPLLTSLLCTSNEITSLDVSGCSSLSTLSCGYNRLTQLDVSTNPGMHDLNLQHNRVTSLDISSCPWITSLNCAENNLTSLDVAGRSSLDYLFCYTNRITELDLTGCDQLHLVNCGSNILTRLNVNGCKRLDRLFCYDNRLDILDIHELTNVLSQLHCAGNKLTELDLTGFRQLTQLECSYNALQHLKLDGCTSLTALGCARNQISSLDLSACGMLGLLDCTSNRLTSLDLSNAPYMNELYCTDNPILSEIPEAFDRMKVFEHDARYEYHTETDPISGKKNTVSTDLGRGWWYPGEPGKGAHIR